MIRLSLCALSALSLAACDRGPGTSVTINADGGNVLGAVDGATGQVKIAVPGFSGQLKLPKVQLKADNFDLNGVHLYPGSTIDAVDVAGGRNDDGGLRVRFTSPASPDQVRGWFTDRLAKAGFTVHPDGQGLTGTTEEQQPFHLDLAGDGSNARGTITVGG